MAIYRGDGGAGDATNDITINQITELSSNAQAAATSASSSATSASTSAGAASTSATNAANSATAASTSETNAASSATSAASSATNAASSETNAAASETAAAASETAAGLSETAAAASETNAATSATNAATSATSASTSATSASSSASSASTSATNASTSETNAASSASAAATSATNAASSATSASNDAATATTKASEASTSASNAATSETNAAASESAAATSATNASTSETNAAASETAAASSASAASTSATNAATSASSASTSASNASTSASNAATSETNAATSETNAAASATAAAASAASAASSDYATSSWYTTTNNSSNWNTAYGWGDHASAGYLTSETYTGTVTSVAATVPTGFAVTGSPITTTGTLAIAFDTGYSLPTTASQTNWDTAYGWGDHASAGYVVADGAVVINESGADVDFRIESDTDANAFFLEGSSGNVGIGTSSPSQLLTLASSDPRIRLEDTDQSVDFELINSGGDGLLTTNGLGNIRFETNNTERMRITSSGDLLLGKTSSNLSTDGIELKANNTAYFTRSAAATVLINRNTSNGAVVSFRRSNSTVGSISVTTTATAYNTSSDYRLKEDLQPIVGASDRVKALNPVNFAWKSNGERVDGFLAHEAQEVVPEAVSGTKDAVQLWEEGDELPEGVVVGDNKLDDDGNTIPEYQGIDQSKLVPLLTSALQEAIGRIETLEAEVTALKG